MPNEKIEQQCPDLIYELFIFRKQDETFYVSAVMQRYRYE